MLTLGISFILLQPNLPFLSMKKVLPQTYLCEWEPEDLVSSPLKQLISLGTQLFCLCLSQEHNCKQSLSGTIWLPQMRRTVKSVLLKAESYPLEIIKNIIFLMFSPSLFHVGKWQQQPIYSRDRKGFFLTDYWGFFCCSHLLFLNNNLHNKLCLIPLLLISVTNSHRF